MNKTQAMARLRSLGSDSIRKTWTRHGVTAKAFGVRYGDMYKLVKEIGVDHSLARALWTTKNHDARVLAMMVADPSATTATELDTWAKELDTWAKELDSYPITDAFASFASKTSLARRRMEKWLRSKQEWTSVAGWALVSSLSQPGGALEDDELETLLGHIEDNIHGAQNRERHSMNNALISIGGRSAGLRKLAVASAKRIGKVEVDRGGTSCKTPDAASYIMKVAAHQKEMAQRRAKKASTKKKATKKKGTKKKGTKKKGTKRVPARRK